MNEEHLDQLLHTWKAEAEQPPSFQRDVWRRIEMTEPPPAALGWLGLFLNWVARPVPAFAVCALALAAGVTAGGFLDSASSPSAAHAYADSINPFVKVALR